MFLIFHGPSVLGPESLVWSLYFHCCCFVIKFCPILYNHIVYQYIIVYQKDMFRIVIFIFVLLPDTIGWCGRGIGKWRRDLLSSITNWFREILSRGMYLHHYSVLQLTFHLQNPSPDGTWNMFCWLAFFCYSAIFSHSNNMFFLTTQLVYTVRAYYEIYYYVCAADLFYLWFLL